MKAEPARGAPLAATLRDACGLEPASAERLFTLYGVMAWEIMRIGRAKPELLRSFDTHGGALGAEVVYAIRHELAQTLSDFLLRRTVVGLGPDAEMSALEPAARIAVRHAG